MTLTAAQVRALAPFADEGAGTPLTFGRAMTRTAYLRGMAWLMPRLLRVAPHIDYVLVSARKPDTSVVETS